MRKGQRRTPLVRTEPVGRTSGGAHTTSNTRCSVSFLVWTSPAATKKSS